MALTRIRAGRAGLTLLLLGSAPAAAAGQVAHRLVLAAGTQHVSLLDPVASPVRYSGGGLSLGLGYETAGPAAALAIRLDGWRPRLSSQLTGAHDLPRERQSELALDVRRLWGEHPLAGGAWRVGAAFGARVAIRTHWYAQAPVALSYFLSLATVGPAVQWGRPLLGGELRTRADVPLLGVGYRPYGDAEELWATSRVRLLGPAALRSAGVGAGLTLPLTSRWSGRLRLDGRLCYLRFRDESPYREAGQTLSAALELPLGGGR